ncbi:hypothetical protein CONCODRAFT_71548 [Conidiobolus coronatus NRRL 28638]|uniref:Uncharacterized protein n=1 Tax=Conidiobolus coronatus (strain ATCC 28846 / CBS 209.66 / NRRL 28638) TaxID=796925 RepID=A0A137P2Y4_CONC2|nr:hypothetical protein CONCODRAFT_71548 [Conidiobolus coronatus NRRL 28638]|eukprot:KXN69338.1 hypothetical protein CONCODRAFT_71548 [Conidiobolus coronatus NRRL 28638]
MKLTGLVSALLISSYSGYYVRRDFFTDLTKSLQGSNEPAAPPAPKTDNEAMADKIQSYVDSAPDYINVAKSAIRMQLTSEQKKSFDDAINTFTNHPEVQTIVADSKKMFSKAMSELRRR